MKSSQQSIWFAQPSSEGVDKLSDGSMAGLLGIKCEEVGVDYIKFSMPVDSRTLQPFGVLHGGASLVLAETAGSVGATYCVDSERFICYGLEINANHVRSVRTGHVIAMAKPEHLGRTTQVWSIRISDEQERLVCTSRITMAVLERKR